MGACLLATGPVLRASRQGALSLVGLCHGALQRVRLSCSNMVDRIVTLISRGATSNP